MSHTLIIETTTTGPGMTPRKRNIVITGAAVAVLALVLASALANGYLTSAKSGGAKQNEGVGIQGAVTITVYGPAGQVVQVLKTHNSLVSSGENWLAACISNAPSIFILGSGASVTTTSATGAEFCPGGSYGFPSYTQYIGVAIGSCTSIGSNCGVLVGGTNTLTPNTPDPCTYSSTCTGWLATATFSPSALNCQASSCALNDVAASACATASCGGQFDDIPSANFPSPVSVAPGDSLAINIQFTVS